MQFIYVLPSWEGSTADGRVLRDALRRTNGLNIHNGEYIINSRCKLSSKFNVKRSFRKFKNFVAPFLELTTNLCVT